MKIENVAAQLFTCRDLLKTPTDIAHTLKRLRKIGYQAVQVSGMGPIAEEELNAILDGEGLICCATHESGETILNNPARVIERLQKLRCKYTAYPFPGGIDFGKPASVAELIGGLQRSGTALAEAGLVLCYHNHNHEFRKVGSQTVLELIYQGTTPEALQGEIDTFWVQYGGGDNVEWCERLKGRLPLIHLKDYMTTSENKHAFCEIGAGNLNFSRIIPAAEAAGCEWFIVEQDTCPGDPVDSLEQSFRYIQENLVS
jgi:sugar phosphate isomerase/epimerase